MMSCFRNTKAQGRLGGACPSNYNPQGELCPPEDAIFAQGAKTTGANNRYCSI